MTAGELAEILDLALVGDGSLELTGIAEASEAEDGQLAFAESEKAVASTDASVILMRPCFVSGKTLLFTHERPQVTAVRAAFEMISRGVLEDWSDGGELAPSGCAFISPEAEIGEGVRIGAGATVERLARIGDGSVICSGAHVLAGTVIGAGARIGHGSVIGADAYFPTESPDLYGRFFVGIGRTVIGDRVRVGCCSVIQRGAFSDTVIGDDVTIGDQVGIGHDARIGPRVTIVAQSGMLGNVKIGEEATLCGRAAVGGGVSIGRRATILGRAGVTKDVPDGAKIYGPHGREASEEMRFLARLRRLAR